MSTQVSANYLSLAEEAMGGEDQLELPTTETNSPRARATSLRISTTSSFFTIVSVQQASGGKLT